MRNLDITKQTKQYPKVALLLSMVLTIFQTLVRFRFPNRVELQAEFRSSETTENLVAFVREQLVEPIPLFHLCIHLMLFTCLFTLLLFQDVTPPPMRLQNGVSLQKQQLSPAAVVHVGVEKSLGGKLNHGFI